MSLNTIHPFTAQSVVVFSMTFSMTLLFAGCDEMPTADSSFAEDAGVDEDEEVLGEEIDPRAGCDPVFPVAEAHNIGFDGSCPQGQPCPVSCPDMWANSDYGPRPPPGNFHHGVDVFARDGAPLVAVVDGVVVQTGDWPNLNDHDGSGIYVKIQSSCDGWFYYYGHLKQRLVNEGDPVVAGQLIGYMGDTGANSTHLHFNMSQGEYENDVDPGEWLMSNSPTACGSTAAVPALKLQNENTTVGYVDAIGGGCYFRFRHGNFGSAAYAAIMIAGGACTRVQAKVTAATDPNNIFTATDDEIVPSVEAQATYDGAPLLGADYCIETGAGGSYVFGYDGFTGQLRDEAVRGYGCDG